MRMLLFVVATLLWMNSAAAQPVLPNPPIDSEATDRPVRIPHDRPLTDVDDLFLPKSQAIAPAKLPHEVDPKTDGPKNRTESIPTQPPLLVPRRTAQSVKEFEWGKETPQTTEMASFVFRLRYVAAKTVAHRIDEQLRRRHNLKAQQRGLVIESPVVIVPEPVSNSLIVAATPEYLAEIQQLILRADREPKTFLIQAKMSTVDENGRESVLSRPQIITLSGHQARVEIGTEQGTLRWEFTVEELPFDDESEDSFEDHDVPIYEPPPRYQEPTAKRSAVLPLANRLPAPPLPQKEHATWRSQRAKLQRRLAAPTAPSTRHKTFKEALEQFSKQANLNIVIDQAGCEEAGVGLDSPTMTSKFDVHDVAHPHTALTRFLKPYGLAFTIQDDDVIYVTSRERSLGELVVTVYPVVDLIVDADGHPNSDALNELAECIAGTVDPDSWEQLGGCGSVQPFETTHSLVIRQRKKRHAAIAELLDELRAKTNPANKQAESIQPVGGEESETKPNQPIPDLILPQVQ